jgi:protein-tyrosine phosphatase
MYVDLHCHLLPGLDDGSADLEAAVSHVRRLEAVGVRDVACTPHIKRIDFPDLDVGELAGRRAEVVAAVAAEGLGVRIHGGGELAHEEALVRPEHELELIAQGPYGGRWLLLECPFEGLDEGFLDAIDRLHSLGYGVLAAHPERSFEIEQRMGVLRAAVERGALVQVNVSSLLGNHGRVERDVAWRLLPDAFCLASDGHPGTRDDLLSVAADLLGERDVRRLTQENPGALLRAGVDPPPSRSAARSWNARRPRWAAEAAY